ncbi:MAG TPA: WG repeat-containing protein [Chitinophagaceae bacterium]|nr:WG repeat-containing protein [Chitinophagaceae bacterium]
MRHFIFFPCFLLFSFTGESQSWTKNYDLVDACDCGIYKVVKNNKYGYADEKGKLIIPLIYDDGMSFSEGRAGVMIEKKWGFIDSAGNEIVKPLYTEVYSFHEGLAVVAKEESFGFIDLTGKLVIPLMYSNARSFGNQLAPVCNSKMIWGYINKTNKVVIPFQYNYADSFTEGTARIMKGGKWMYIDVTGKVVKIEE